MRTERRVDADLPRELLRAEPGGDDDPRDGQSLTREIEPEAIGDRRDARDQRVMPQGSACRDEGRVQSGEKPQRIDVAVAPAVARAGHVGSQLRLRQQALERGSVDHLPVGIAAVPLVVQPLQGETPPLEIRLAEAEDDAAVPLVAESGPGSGLEPVSEASPEVDAPPRQALVGRQA